MLTRPSHVISAFTSILNADLLKNTTLIQFNHQHFNINFAATRCNTGKLIKKIKIKISAAALTGALGEWRQ